MAYRTGDRLIKAYIASPLGFTEPTRQFYGETYLPALRAVGVDTICPWEMTDPAEGVFALDTDSLAERAARYDEFVRRVFARNETAIRDAEIVIAQLDGTDADAGTAWEVGFGYALGKPIFGWRSDWRNSGELAGRVTLMAEGSIPRSGGFLHFGEMAGFMPRLAAALDDLRVPLAMERRSP